MFSLVQRFQQVSSLALSCGFVAIAFIIATSWYQLVKDNAFDLKSSVENIRPKISMVTSKRYGVTNKTPKESARINFDLDADLSPLFNWNTKQIFVYLTAEYNGKEKPDTFNKITFWDKIITQADDAKISLSNEKAKYNVWDVENKLSNRDLTFKLNWNIQPWAGFLLNGETSGSTTIQFNQTEDNAKQKRQAKGPKVGEKKSNNA